MRLLPLKRVLLANRRHDGYNIKLSMDFLDPKKQRRSRIMLSVGYILIAGAIAIGTVILLFQANGFGFDKNGQIIQNGLVFISSQPSGASVYLNNTPHKVQTNTRMVLQAGTYQVKLSAPGYRDWQRQITVNGGDLQHFDYPFLFPSNLKTKTIASISATPDVVTQSPDKNWLVVERSDNKASFDLYDLSNPLTHKTTTIAVPSSDVTTGDAGQTWVAVDWASDNRHVLMLHSYVVSGQPAHEYVVLDRQTPDSSVNITKTLTIPAEETLTLFNKKYNQYYAFNHAAGTLRTTSLDNSLNTQQIAHVLAYKSYGSDIILYATDVPPNGKVQTGLVSIVLQQGQKTYTLRTLPAGAPQYLLNLATYSGDWYVTIAASNDKGLYIYKNPQTETDNNSGASPSPWRFLLVANPTYVSFSDNTQFIAVENGQQFAVYDAENVLTYMYKTTQPVDAPQGHATWMDGDRLMYVSSGKLTVFDYDHQNVQTLQSNDPTFMPAFDPSFKYVFSVTPGATPNSASLTSTPLTTLP